MFQNIIYFYYYYLQLQYHMHVRQPFPNQSILLDMNLMCYPIRIVVDTLKKKFNLRNNNQNTEKPLSLIIHPNLMNILSRSWTIHHLYHIQNYKYQTCKNMVKCTEYLKQKKNTVITFTLIIFISSIKIFALKIRIRKNGEIDIISNQVKIITPNVTFKRLLVQTKFDEEFFTKYFYIDFLFLNGKISGSK